MTEREIDEETGTTTTGHEWDGIKELNTPLPRWWLWTFYGCIVFALGYTIFYPAWPLITSATGGVLGYSSRADLAARAWRRPKPRRAMCWRRSPRRRSPISWPMTTSPVSPSRPDARRSR